MDTESIARHIEGARTPAEDAFHVALTHRHYYATALAEFSYLLEILDTPEHRDLLIEKAGVDAHELTTSLAASQLLFTGLRAGLALIPGE